MTRPVYRRERVRAPGFGHNRFLHLLLGWLLAFWVAMAFEPFDRSDWLLENALVFVFGFLLVFTYRRFTFSNLSYGLFGIFLSLHMVGAHYTYAETPFGFWLQDMLGFSRNHYDRIVHFSFGLLLAYPIREFLLRLASVRKNWSYLLTIAVVLGFSGLYEALEGLAATIVSPELGVAYLGTQGDEWDAQKDTALALAGSIVAMVPAWYLRRGSKAL